MIFSIHSVFSSYIMFSSRYGDDYFRNPLGLNAYAFWGLQQIKVNLIQWGYCINISAIPLKVSLFACESKRFGQERVTISNRFRFGRFVGRETAVSHLATLW